MRTVQIGDQVKVHYRGSLADGTLFDSSDEEQPLVFNLGQEMVIPGFEKKVLGMSIGGRRTFVLDPEEAYGPHLPELVQTVPRHQLPASLELEAGMSFPLSPHEDSCDVVVVAVEGDSVTIDANHPLAGEVLTFEIELVEIL